jgi:lipoprotein LprG
MTSVRPARATRLLTVLLVPLLAFPVACSGDEGEAAAETPADVLAEAKKQLDETSGVTLSLTTEKLPDGVDGVLEATGVGTHAPAFDGDITLLVNSLSVDLPVVAVDGKVHAKLPFTTTFAEVDPADYGAPDPAGLMSTEGGISGWLTAAEGVTEGDEVRDGERVLTSYTGTIPGDAVASVIPSADKSADFAATFRIDQDGRLDSTEVGGPFYGAKGDVGYTVKLSDYGTEKDITKP